MNDVAAMHADKRRHFPEQEFRDWFTESFMTAKDSQYNTIPPQQRHELRIGFFDYLRMLGYTEDDADWDAWRAVASSAGVMQ